MSVRYAIHESHNMIAEPGPYPPGEGPLDYADCEHRCTDLKVECVAQWPSSGWEYVKEGGFERLKPPPIVTGECSLCGTTIGEDEQEHEGAYGLRMVIVWHEYWMHPSVDDVALCEDCTCEIETT
jgi:hypothetical protein